MCQAHRPPLRGCATVRLWPTNPSVDYFVAEAQIGPNRTPGGGGGTPRTLYLAVAWGWVGKGGSWEYPPARASICVHTPSGVPIPARPSHQGDSGVCAESWVLASEGESLWTSLSHPTLSHRGDSGVAANAGLHLCAHPIRRPYPRTATGQGDSGAGVRGYPSQPCQIGGTRV